MSKGKKNTTVEWDDGGKIGNNNKLILSVNTYISFLQAMSLSRSFILSSNNISEDRIEDCESIVRSVDV